jgi:hypothetical protein
MSLTGLNLYHAQLILRVSRRQKGKPESKNKPTNSAIHTSDADRRRKILMTTSKCTTNFKERWDQGGSLGKSGKSGTSAFFSGRLPLYPIMFEKLEVTKTNQNKAGALNLSVRNMIFNAVLSSFGIQSI